MPPPEALPPAVRSYMHGHVARGRCLALARRAGAALTLLLAWTLLWCGADRFIQLPAGVRLAGLSAGILAAIAVLAGPFRRWRAGPADWVAVAEEIERQDPRFDQRLVTVTSRLLGRPEHRGSDEILEHLVYQVDREAAARRSATLTPLRTAAAPWLALLMVLAAAAGLVFVPELGLPRLAARFAAPWAALAPVTKASLSVYPGDRDVPQSNPLQIDADAQRVDGGQVWLWLSDDGKTWARSAMNATSVNAAGDGRYSFSLASVDRDVLYYVSGGDARSPQYFVRVLRSPAVAEFGIRYTYPAYAGKPPLSVVNADGVIEAPVGTEAMVTVTATEPLQLALLTGPAGEKVLLTRAGADNVRQGRLTVQRDGRYQVDLVSMRDVTGAGPPTMEVRAQPDRPPVVRLAEAGATLRLNPRDILPISYEVLDDYGIDSVTLHVQSGVAPAVELPLYPGNARGVDGASAGSAPIAGPPLPASRVATTRRVNGEFDFDLATLPLSIGDVLTLGVTAKDSGGQSTLAAPLQVLVSPRSIGPDAYDRLADLAEASRLADAMADELSAAMKASEGPPPSADAGATSASAATSRRDRHLDAAIESAAMARRALLRALAHGASPRLCAALAAWVDAAQAIASRMTEITRWEGPAGPSQWDASFDGIKRASEVARELQSGLKTVAQGERATAVLADRESVAAAEKRPAPSTTSGQAPPESRGVDRLRQTLLQRTREDIAAGAAAIGLDAKAPDFEAQLNSKAAAADSAIASCHEVDFAAAAREWARHSSLPARARNRRGVLAERLSAAAEAEAVRRDADLVRACDLHLASQSAVALADDPSAKNTFAGVMSALQQDRDLNRRPAGPERAEDAPIRAGAARAREQLARWAGDDGMPALATTRSIAPAALPAMGSARAEGAESLALRAGSESVRRKYAAAAETDQALFHVVERLAASGPAPGQEASTERADVQIARRARVELAGQEVSRSMKAAEKLDGLSDGQKKLAEETRRANAEAAPALAGRERDLADQITHMTPVRPTAAESPASAGPSGSPPSQPGPDDATWRDRAVAAVLTAQARLAAMPRQLTEALEDADGWRRSVQRAQAARREAGAASDEHKAAARRAAEQADQDADDASKRLESAAAPVAPVSGEALCTSLDPFSPEAAGARSAMTDALLPAMKSLAGGLRSDDAGAAGQSAATLRRAIETCQIELARARDVLAERDPLVAARWFARAAADALGRKPPDFPLALQHQDLTAAALARAWDASIHHAAALRLAELPTLRALYAPSPTADGSRLAAGPGARPTGNNPGAGAAGAAPMARDWRRLPPRDGEGPAATPHQPDPAGYEAALRAYFEALGNK